MKCEWGVECPEDPYRVITTVHLLASRIYTTQLPVTKSFKSQSSTLQNTPLSNYCFCFFSPKVSSLPHENNVKPQLLQDKQNTKTNMHLFCSHK